MQAATATSRSPQSDSQADSLSEAYLALGTSPCSSASSSPESHSVALPGASSSSQTSPQLMRTTARIRPANRASAKVILTEMLNDPFEIASLMIPQRRQFTQALLDDVRILAKEKTACVVTDDELRRLILSTLKECSRLSGGSNVQSEPTNLRILLAQITRPPPVSPTIVDRFYASRTAYAPPEGDLSASIPAADIASSLSSSSSSSSSFLQRTWSKLSATKSSDGGNGGNFLRKPARAGSGSSTDSRTASSASNELPPSLVQSKFSITPASRRPSAPDAFAVPVRRSSAAEATSASQAIDWECTDTALRCLNNALFLHETSRRTFAEDRIGGGQKMISLLKNPWQTPADIIFLACRLLFYATLFEASFNRLAVEDEFLVENLCHCLNALTAAWEPHAASQAASSRPSSGSGLVGATPLPTGSAAQVRMAIGEVLKVVFNLGLYYPRVASDRAGQPSGNPKEPATLSETWHDRLSVLFDPVLRLLLLLPADSLTPPATNAIGVLLNFPVKPFWAEYTRRQQQQQQQREQQQQQHQQQGGAPLSRIRTSPSSFNGGQRRRSSAGSPLSIEQPMNIPRSRNSSTSSAVTSPASPVAHLCALLSSFLSRYFPPNSLTSPTEIDIDHSSVSRLAKADGVDVSDIGQPLLLLLRKLCVEDDECRKEIRSRWLPDDVDRSVGLDRQATPLGRLIRLMSAGNILYPRLSRVAGEFLLAMCDSSPDMLVGQIGYGPVAGFLVETGLTWSGGKPQRRGSGDSAGANPTATVTEIKESSSSSKSHVNSASNSRSNSPRSKQEPLPPVAQAPINPITGAVDPITSVLTGSSAAKGRSSNLEDLPPMTEEEKEAEADRLLSLLSRLDRNGVISIPDSSHPLKGQESFRRREEWEAKEGREREEKERKEEEEGWKEWKAYKDGKERRNKVGTT